MIFACKYSQRMGNTKIDFFRVLFFSLFSDTAYKNIHILELREK